jgi:WD40 repeat protein
MVETLLRPPAASSQKAITLNAHALGVWTVAYSPDGKRIACGGGDGTVKVWDATAGPETLR